MGKIRQAINISVAKLLKPLVRILLRQGVSFEEFVDIGKRVFVEVSEEDFRLEGRKQSVSRVSILTGINRKEVKRILALPPIIEFQPQSQNRAVKVVNGWLRDEEFLDDQRSPSVLPFEGSGSSFSQLVKRYSGDMPVRAILDELIHSGAVIKTEDNFIKLRSHAYIPHEDQQQKIEMLGGSVSDLLTTIDHNLEHSGDESRLQLMVEYDNLPADVLEEFQQYSQEHAHNMLELLNIWLADRDRDASKNIEGQGRFRAGVGIYYFEENLGEGDK